MVKKLNPVCPECKGIDLDVFPEGNKFGYCYTCHQSIMVVYPSSVEAKQKTEGTM